MAGDKAWLLPEIHDTWQTAKKLEEHDVWSYDFVLPFLLLHALYTGETHKLKGWLDVAPSTQFTVLDTPDGIGNRRLSGCRFFVLLFGITLLMDYFFNKIIGIG